MHRTSVAPAPLRSQSWKQEALTGVPPHVLCHSAELPLVKRIGVDAFQQRIFESNPGKPAESALPPNGPSLVLLLDGPPSLLLLDAPPPRPMHRQLVDANEIFMKIFKVLIAYLSVIIPHVWGVCAAGRKPIDPKGSDHHDEDDDDEYLETRTDHSSSPVAIPKELEDEETKEAESWSYEENSPMSKAKREFSGKYRVLLAKFEEEEWQQELADWRRKKEEIRRIPYMVEIFGKRRRLAG
ncbi:hypothetical protein H0H92_008460 [Tricholoma furcatifolium]|nr:hypothetical protein H0H92_008460 [Tricholoma furcatifolium]